MQSLNMRENVYEGENQQKKLPAEKREGRKKYLECFESLDLSVLQLIQFIIRQTQTWR